MDDAQLVQQAKQGQRSAYGQLVQRWAARLVAFLRSRVLLVDVAEDLAQESFLRAFRRLDSLEDPSKFGSWLFSIGQNAVMDWRKAKTRQEVQLSASTAGDDAEDFLPVTLEQPSEEALKTEQQEILLRAVHELPAEQRETILLYYYEDVTYAELAKLLGVSVATVNARLGKARNALRQKLGAKWCLSEV